ncbi:hypothetical protein L6452_17439 [Arctium lappa]|uniref:Uncharacterized protein n=1 Tax=Arctium lappa TaxID=4217 RepID=A0ACB9C3D1_ARCLA|nr:hypothetical protein L6452_17439 [Arctium lappa]
MKTKFFLCMRPPVIETDDGDYVKLPPSQTVRSSYSKVTAKTSGGRLQHRKRVAPEKFIRQPSIKSNSNRFSGNISSDGKSENPLQKDCQKSTSPVSETNISVPFPGEKSVSLKKLNLNISNSKVSGGPESSNSGVYLMVTSLFFTIFLGKILGILCTLILLYSLFPRRKRDVNYNDDRGSMNMVGKSPEKGSPEEYKKRVIMEGLLERKSHNRESIKFLS